MKESKIRLLSLDVVHRIAAGEVVEGPASVIKELVENAIDAGASRVIVKILAGGLELIQVQDNGEGMSQADLEVCCHRHATSKISSLADLDRLQSLGFRGEALAALSAISQLEIISLSRSSSDDVAWRLFRAGSEFSTVPATHSEGTTVRVHRLFFNTPARLKFLKSESTEANKCVRIFKELAVAHPYIDLNLYVMNEHGELEEEFLFAAVAQAERLAQLFNKDASEFLVATAEPTLSGLKRLEIVVQRAPNFSRNGKDLYFVVNNRCVEDKRLPYVLREAFGALIEVGAYPRGAVIIDVDQRIVDVNVHPQKREVRWNKEFPLYSLVYESLKEKLGTLRPKADLQIQKPLSFFDDSLFGEPKTVENTVIEFARPKSRLGGEVVVAPAPVEAASAAPRFSELRVVGEVGAAWLICESSGGLLVIDQHAAHERLRFQEFLDRDLFPSSALLIPLVFDVPASGRGSEERVLRLLENFGFEGNLNSLGQLEFFAEPKTERKINWQNIFGEIFERIEDAASPEALLNQMRIWIASSLACHGSVRRGQRLTNDEIKALLRDLDGVNWKEFCPHGRPTWILLSHSRLEEEFHRS